MAAAARFDGDLCVEVAAGAAGSRDRSRSLPEVEEPLRGQRWTPELIEEAAALAYRSAHPMDNTAGTIALRRRVVRSYTEKALNALKGEDEA